MKEEDSDDVSFDNKMVTVTFYGMVVASATFRFVTSCSVNLSNFPYNSQTCQIQFHVGAKNTYISLQGVLKENQIDVGETLDVNDEWQNVKMTQTIKPFPYNAFGYMESMDIVTMVITMDRNPVFYIIYLLIPSVLMAFVSVLVFLLPPDSGERVGLSITVLLSYTVFLLMVSEFTPRGGNRTPALGKPSIYIPNRKYVNT